MPLLRYATVNSYIKHGIHPQVYLASNKKKRRLQILFAHLFLPEIPPLLDKMLSQNSRTPHGVSGITPSQFPESQENIKGSRPVRDNFVPVLPPDTPRALLTKQQKRTYKGKSRYK